MKIATIGGSGFVGSHVVSFALSRGLETVAIKAPRLDFEEGGSSGLPHPCWSKIGRAELDELSDALRGVEVVVNAAGLARPGSRDVRALHAANAVLPVFIAGACRRAGVRRMVHVSTAAVQGRLEPLDESPRCFPFSPYSRSKADGERWLQELEERPEEIIVYRPTSVHGRERRTTTDLARFAAAPVVPVAGGGSQALPVALIENVAAGIVFAAAMPSSPSVVLQPSEGQTTARLLRLFGARRLVSLPQGMIEIGLRTLRLPARVLPSLNTPIRALELLFYGQTIDASTLREAGFVAPIGEAGWSALATALRDRQVDSYPASTAP